MPFFKVDLNKNSNMKSSFNINNTFLFHYKFVWVILLILIGKIGIAQINTQTLRGTVTDQDNQEALVGVNIQVLKLDNIGTTTDQDGTFRLEDMPVGRYQIQATYVGYKTVLFPEVVLVAGKETILNIEMQESSSDLETVEVRATAQTISTNAVPLGIHTLTIDEVRRFPATFNDPARLAVSLAGVVNDNDQANGISVRGNSPANMVWRLEGLDIVNPNHLSNAGTFSDRPTASGGGVNILSAQLLGTSNFLKGAFPVGYGNALSGIMDMNFRTGNNQQREYTMEFGLLGVDLSTEGPFSTSSDASYLVNYRYSFVGILDLLGVSFGGEAISFQDLSFNIHIPTKKGTLGFFGIGGISKNEFTAERDTSLWEFQKDNQDILYQNKMGAVGVTYDMTINSQWSLESAVALSTLEVSRTSNLLMDDLTIESLYEQDQLDEQKIAFQTFFNYKLDTQNRFKIGVNATQYSFSQSRIFNFLETIPQNANSGLLLQPFANWQYKKANWVINTGLQYSYFSLNESSVLEPRASIRYNLDARKYLAASYGLHSQLQRPQVYSSGFENDQLDFTKAHHVSLGYHQYLNNTTKFSAEAYYQSLFDVPIINDSIRTFSTINLIDQNINATLTNAGTGTNYGLELSLQRYIQNGFYYLVNTSLYRSLYVAGDGVERSTRFDGNYILNITSGKEWTKTKKGKNKTWGVNARLTYLGGYRDSPIDVAASRENRTTTYVEKEAFSIQQDPYFKLDVRLYYKKSKGNRSSMIALDLQNATSQENVAFSYYDTQQERVVIQNQLGLIPNLSYRIQF